MPERNYDDDDDDVEEAGYEGALDGSVDEPSDMLPEAALLSDDTPGLETSLSQSGMLARDKQKKTAYFDYLAEKEMSQADSKLFFQRSQLEGHKTGSGSNWGNSQKSAVPSPVLKPKSFSNVLDSEQGGLHRSGSQASGKSAQNLPQLNKFRSAPPIGLADLGKHPESAVIQEPSLAAGAFVHTPGAHDRRESLLRADKEARDHTAHPGLPHEHKPLLEMEGLHGAGAGVGLGSGAGGFANTDAHITAELASIYTNIQKVIDIRHKYIRLSLQEDGDNPKDDPNWNIYPPPPQPSWHDERAKEAATNARNSTANSLANSMVLPPQTDAHSHQRTLSGAASELSISQATSAPKTPLRRRKPGQDIGSDFEMEDLLPLPPPGEMTFRLDGSGVFQVYENSKLQELDTPVINIPDIREFYMDLEQILNVSSDGPSKSFAFRRLQYLEGKFNLYVLLNEYQEMADSKRVPHRDFYNVRKVDTHVHHSACMNQKHLLRFIKSKMKKNPDEIVMFRDGKHLTLAEVFQSINLTAYDLSIDTLDMHVPRLFDVYKSSGLMENFEQVIINLFQPLFEVTKDPSSHPKLHIFLQRVIGFDSVDDESKAERRLFRKFPVPKVWDSKQNPPYSYWIYYLFANISSLNVWRKQRGFNTFLLRPHCGEAGDTDHLAAAVLCCHSISHGLLLRKVPLLQYIFYLEQIGVAMSPLSNNALFLAYERNPFLSYFKRGLNVSLSTDDPLQFAFTKEPLIEEYSVAAQIYKLSAVDMCELAKNSVKQSGFEHSVKQRWLGPDYDLPGVKGNTMAKSNVPNIREGFRHETLMQELSMIERYTALSTPAIQTSAPAEGNSFFPGPRPHSPTSSMKASASVVDHGPQQYQHHPAQAARIPLSHSQLHVDSHLKHHQKGTDSPSGYATPNQQTQPNSSFNSPHSANKGREKSWGLEASFSDLHLSGSEPRIFPGLVSRKQRRESTRKNSVTESDEHGLMMLKRGSNNKSVTTLDEENDAQQSDVDIDDAADSN
ncbi:hypothetical protein SS1G_07853 [Sclerotinia sclerotiorum 1980 UF-70]|uniref:AMP deaminase n=1 Tax=Sclerotinia sclerotiorum (strain ATCC 18683 / 1980 / Ss-1) TaxID=665079 RepID=A7ER99_SCLS1|nr:hypothetical protein SS1G_07853 [Sclerotinia sclerotiorum 1980 UF-70]EDN91991.1 hypothetical protein SS1G_07853 [Sclerotinia sclerotiorum 1980 UF-70]